MATIVSGTVCAITVGMFDVTLAKSLILAFFLTLVLGLGESVAMQTMAITVHSLHNEASDKAWYWKMLKRELGRTLLLGIAAGLIVGCIAIIWKGNLIASVVIASGILISLLLACFLGVSLPVLLHRFRLDLRVASGPVTLALADMCTIAVYFSLAALLLGR
jgi:magnesium transporter